MTWHGTESRAAVSPAVYRLGVPVKILGGGGLRSHDSRRWQNRPHLSVSLVYLRDIFAYLASRRIHFYRMANQLAPYVTHPDLPHFHRQVDECATELAALGDLARERRLRLSIHPAHHIQLNSPHPEWAQRSSQDLAAAAYLLEAMGAGPEAVLVVHMGGVYGDAGAGRERFVRQMDRLPLAVRSRLALENDDHRYSLQDALWVHRRTGIRLVLDVLHHRCLNPTAMPMIEALTAALNTWPAQQQPKIHMSSPRTAIRVLTRPDGPHLLPPLSNQHSDFIHPFEFVDLLQAAQQARLRPFDIMLEAKAKDLALLRLRQQLHHYAPEIGEAVK